MPTAAPSPPVVLHPSVRANKRESTSTGYWNAGVGYRLLEFACCFVIFGQLDIMEMTFAMLVIELHDV